MYYVAKISNIFPLHDINLVEKWHKICCDNNYECDDYLNVNCKYCDNCACCLNCLNCEKCIMCQDCKNINHFLMGSYVKIVGRRNIKLININDADKFEGLDKTNYIFKGISYIYQLNRKIIEESMKYEKTWMSIEF